MNQPSSASIRQFIISMGAFGGIIAILFLLASAVGPVMAVVYGFLFIFMLTLLPVVIGLFAGATPNSIGKLHLVLGAVAFNHHYLVQRKHGWEWCPGDRGRVYIDGEWHDIESGHENYSVLGWRPFGILRYKDDDTWTQQRVDTKAKRQRGVVESDGGGTESVTRGSFEEAADPAGTGIDGWWVVDLKRVFSRGLQRMGDIELIETAEEVIERGQVDEDRMGGLGPVVRRFAFVLLGVVTGFVYILIA